MSKRPNTHVTISIPIPLVGTELFNELTSIEEVKMAYRSRGNIDTVDSFDYELLIRLLTKHMTNIDYNILMTYVKRGKVLAAPHKDDVVGHYARFKIAKQYLKQGGNAAPIPRWWSKNRK